MSRQTNSLTHPRTGLIVVLLGVLGMPQASGAQSPHEDRELVEALRLGGHVLVCRHTATDHSAGDRGSSRAQQRNLTAAGERDADRIGAAVRALRIPIGDVRSNVMYRNRETAERAFGRMVVDSSLAGSGAADAIRAVIGTSVPAGTNTVLVTRIGILMQVFRGRARQIDEGDCVVTRASGDGDFEVVAVLAPDDWERLAAK